MLTVHHLDLNKSNCHWWNIPALCQRCHLTIQGKVIIERPWMFEHSDWFKPYVAGYYAFTYGLPDDRPTVELHLKALILIGQGIQPPDLQRTQNTPLELSNGAKASANRRTGEIPV